MLLILLTGVGLALSNCGGSLGKVSGSATATPTGTTASSATPTATATAVGSLQTGQMFVASQGGSGISGAPIQNVGVYPPGANGNIAPAPDFTGFNSPSGVAFDPVAGILYVSDLGGEQVLTFQQDGTEGSLSGPDSQNILNPISVAVDAASNIYVLNQGIGSSPFLQVYPAGSHDEDPPSFTIAGSNTGLIFPFGVAVDGDGNIFVRNTESPISGGNNSILEFAAGACASGTCNIAPVTTITGSNTQLANVSGIALDSLGNIWVTNPQGITGGSVLEFTLGSCTGTCNLSPVATITDGLAQPFGIAIDKRDQIYVANATGGNNQFGSVTVYSPEGALISTVNGANTLLTSPVAIAIGATP